MLTAPDTALSTGSAVLRSAAVRAVANVAVAFSPASMRDAVAASAETMLKLTVAAAVSRWRVDAAATLITVTVEALTFNVDAMEAVTVAFCAAPKLAAETPAKEMEAVDVVCVTEANPGGSTRHATAPADGE